MDRTRCFRCGSELVDMGNEDAMTTSGETMAYTYQCPNCGDMYGRLEQPDFEKPQYKYWQ